MKKLGKAVWKVFLELVMYSLIFVSLNFISKTIPWIMPILLVITIILLVIMYYKEEKNNEYNRRN